MKHGFLKALVLAVFVSMIICQPSAFAQGSLTPPGAPGVTMKTLDQVEPRIPISSATYDITRAGSYYLTTNISGISIQSGNVTLDLMGYSISASGGSAIYFYDAYINVVIRNGTLSSLIGNGIQCGATASNARGLIEQVRIQNCSGIGLNLPAGYVVRDCAIYGCSYGIVASGAIEVRNCRLESNGTALILPGSSTVVGNTIINNTGDGLQVTGTGSYVADNIVKGNRDNYNISAGNQLNLLLSQIPETLDWPCSVKLAGTLTCSLASSNGITVNADDVTIDMDGHMLVGPGYGSGSGIYQADTRRNLTVLNGKVVNWRAVDKGGISAGGKAARISGIQAASNDYGIIAGSGSTIISCKAIGNWQGISAGIGSTLSDCAAQTNSGRGISTAQGCTLSGCSAAYNYIGIYAGDNSTLSGCSAPYNDTGITAGSGCLLNNCTASENTTGGISTRWSCVLSDCAAARNAGYGISTGSDCNLNGCSAQYNKSDGFKISSNSTINNSVAFYNGLTGDGAGIHVVGLDSRIEGNNVTGNYRGIDVDSAGNFFTRNTASGNTSVNWYVAPGNVCLVVQAATNASLISGNSGGTAPGSLDPNANFTY